MTENEKVVKIGIILGSNRPNRICRSIGEWVQKEMKHKKLAISLIDLAEINLPFLDEPELPAAHNYVHQHTYEWSKLINSFDGFLFLVPQYNWGYPAVLKNALDYLFNEWKGKPVSTICYGGHGGFQAELAIKLVIRGLNMYSMVTNPAFSISKEMFASNGQFIDINASLSNYSQSVQAISAEFIDLLVSE